MKSILFDLYGTLIDIHTEEQESMFWKRLSKRTRKYKSFEPIVLKSLYMNDCRLLAESIEEIDILEVFSRLYELSKEKCLGIARTFRKLSTKYIRLYPGVLKLLRRLKKRGYRLFILSNAQSAFTIPELKKLGLTSYFEGIALSSDYGVKKPNLDFFQSALKEFSLEEEVWMVGNDEVCDILPAKRLGLHTLFIESNLTPPHKLSADLIGWDYKKVLKVLDG